MTTLIANFREQIHCSLRQFGDEQTESILNNRKAVETLSQREKAVLRFLLENKKRKDIAETLFVTESTIKKHTSGIFRKLEITNRSELFEKQKSIPHKLNVRYLLRELYFHIPGQYS